MKVSFFTTWETKCGIADYSRFFVTALEERGIGICIVSATPLTNRPGFIKLGRQMNKADIAHVQHDYSFFGRNLFQWAVNFFIFLAPIKVPIIITLHELVIPRAGGALFRLKHIILSRLYRIVLFRVSMVVVHLDKHRANLLDMGLDPDKVVVLPHPIPDVEFPVNRESSTAVPRRGEGKVVLTIFGFIFKRKGYELALSALRGLDDCLLCIAGGTHPGESFSYVESLKRMIKKMGLDDKVNILGYIPDGEIGAVMNSTDIVLAPFVSAAGSGSLSLAVAYHKPIIASDIEPLREMQKRGLAMELFRSGDSTHLREKIALLAGDAERRRQLSDSARHYAEEFSYRSAARAILGLYTTLLVEGRT